MIMKINRSSKCSVKFATRAKRMELNSILKEYGRVVNIFIEHFWKSENKVMKLTYYKY